MMSKEPKQESLDEKVIIPPEKYKAGLKRLLSVSKDELDERVSKGREHRRKKRKAR